jgi:diguanylate cyclase (GGDEF)-like protein
MIEDLTDRTYNIHNYLDNRIDTETFYTLETREDADTETYQKAKKILEQTKNATGVRYLYTAKMLEDGTFIYVVDGLSEDSSDFRYIGDLIEPECIPDMQKALSGQVVLPERINKTTWGPIFITYFPMHDGDEIIGVIGIEFDAARQYESFQKMIILTPIVIIFFCFIASFIAVKWFRRISNPSYQDMASTDFLTGLKNRNSFEIDLNNLSSQSERHTVGLVSIDLDELKKVNDTYGHEIGDRYIKMGSSIIRECLDSSDILYRIGGDEFSVIVKNKDEHQIEEMRKAIKKRTEEEDGKEIFTIRISTGYALYDPEVDSSLFDTLKRADAMMYKNKKEKKAVQV